MTAAVFLAILFAAMLHAGWNAIVKIGLDRFTSVLLIALVQSTIALILLPFFEPPARHVWPWVLAGSALHSCYKLSLIKAYGHGDFSQVYPLARGTAPLIVAVIGATLLGEEISGTRATAVLLIASGIMLMARREGAGPALSRPALAFAMLTAAFIAAYTLVDGIGARLAGSASGFLLWMVVIDGIFLLACALATRGPEALRRMRPAWRSGVSAGAMSLGGYWITIWAFTQAPLAMVAALRETSVLFAMLIAAFLLKESVGVWRWAAASLIVTGVILMRL